MATADEPVREPDIAPPPAASEPKRERVRFEIELPTPAEELALAQRRIEQLEARMRAVQKDQLWLWCGLMIVEGLAAWALWVRR